MRRFSAIWHYDGTYSDQTLALGEGSVSLTVQTGDHVYFGSPEWFAGILTFISTTADPTPTYTLQYFDGDDWQDLPLEESMANLASGVQLQRGSLYWGAAQLKWEKLGFTSTVPNTATPVDNLPRFWVRLNVISGSIVIDRCLPQMYNTYATPEEMGNYIGYEFDNINPPTLNTVRRMLRANEDWFDQYTRRSFRPRVAYNETYDFNAYGIRLRRYPPVILVSVGLWQGNSFSDMSEGRGQDFFLDTNSGMLRFTLPSFRLRYYSWLLSRYMRQSNSVSVTYVYGADFDTSQYAEAIKKAILLKTGADLVNQADWTGVFTSGLDTVSKLDKVKNWNEEAISIADELRMPLIG